MRKTDPKDSSKRYFRASGRTFQMNGAWYFTSREGDVGPFATQKQADIEIRRYVTDQQALCDFQRKREARIDPLAPRPVKREPIGEIPVLNDPPSLTLVLQED
ncbi:MAG: DUF6316 family protein [Pseudomonadota bacterium]